MEAIMKSIVPAALVVVLEAGFLFSIAALPSRSDRIQASMAVAARPAPVAPASAPAARPPSRS